MSGEEFKRQGEPHSAETHRARFWPTNWLIPMTLLWLREWNSYGYELMERTAAFGFKTMNPATFYRTLRQMEKEGIVYSTWRTSGSGPARRMYSITGTGEAYLDFWAESLKQYQQAMDAFLQLYSYGSPSADGQVKKDDG
jgi:PadR family transcriptional regulator PadR